MIRKGKIAVARILPRVQSIARFVALLPSNDPQGFFALFLPYADDIRAPESLLDTINSELPPDRLVEAGSMMMKELHLTELDLENYPNPTLQRFYSVLESLALEQRATAEVQDALMPDAEGFTRKALCIQEFFFQVMEDRPTKRQAPRDKSSSPVPVKVVKVETAGGRGKRGGKRK